MNSHYNLLKVISLLGLINFSAGQAPIAFDDICQREQSTVDNLSCPRIDEVLECYNRSELCDGTPFCNGGSDEGTNLLALDCELINSRSQHDIMLTSLFCRYWASHRKNHSTHSSLHMLNWDYYRARPVM